jgi:hypothetical protein
LTIDEGQLAFVDAGGDSAREGSKHGCILI